MNHSSKIQVCLIFVVKIEINYSPQNKLQAVEETYSEGKQLAQKKLRKLQWMISSLSTQIEEMEAQIKILTGEKEYDFGDYLFIS